MKVLAVDTSSAVAAVAVMDEEKLLGEYLINSKNTHSHKLMPIISDLLTNLDLKASDIDLFAAAIGPGSFTGLRIGISTIKAMSYALDKPVVGINTLDSIANNVITEKSLVCPLIDARNDQVYTAIYRFNDMLQIPIVDYMAVHINELVKMLKGRGEEVCFLGDGVLVHKNFLQLEMKEKCSFGTQDILMQKASTLARLALIKAKKNKIETAFSLIPFYLRQSQAERNYSGDY